MRCAHVTYANTVANLAITFVSRMHASVLGLLALVTAIVTVITAMMFSLLIGRKRVTHCVALCSVRC